MIVWGGALAAVTNTGGLYDPKTRTWTATSLANAPSARVDATAVWTGTKMIVWGGRASDVLDTGGIFDPATNTWSAMSASGAPSPRYQHTAVWTGTKMVVWGGYDGSSPLGDGGAYDPATDTWGPVPAGPVARRLHTAVWTGTKMLVYGGLGYDDLNAVDTPLGDGSLFDPLNGTWSVIDVAGAPSVRYQHAAVWTGTEMIVWGGTGGGNPLSDGAKYSLAQDSWTLMNGPFPEGRVLPVAAWIDAAKRMIMWGGAGKSGPLGSGGSYDPASNAWTELPTAPAARRYHTGVSTDKTFIVWGGDAGGLTSTGAVFDPSF
jgi:N-acetylneuraminic acid mutarotase